MEEHCPTFSLDEFLKYGKFRDHERGNFYSGLQKAAYQLFDKIYIRIGNLNDKFFLEPNKPLESDPIWHAETDKKGQIYFTRLNTYWEEPRFGTLISAKLTKLGCADRGSRTTDYWLLGHSCDLYYSRFYLSFNASFYLSKAPYLVLTLSSPLKTFIGQRLYLSDQTILSSVLGVLEKCKGNCRERLLSAVLPQTLIKETVIHGECLRLRNKYVKQNVPTTKLRRNVLMGDSSGPVKSSYRQYFVWREFDRIVHYSDIGPCFLTVAESTFAEPLSTKIHSKKVSAELSWTYSLDYVTKMYRVSTNRLWKVMAFQKDTMKHFELLLSDMDFKEIYQHFTKNEKEFFELFRPNRMLKKPERVKCLAVLGQKISFRKTDVGTILVIDTKRKSVKEAAGLHVPLKEYIRQKSIMGEIADQGAPSRQTQHSTNARHPVLQTTVKYQGKYLNVTVYYMIPLNAWKIKLRVASTGRAFIADFDSEAFATINRKLEQVSPQRKSSGQFRLSLKQSNENVADAFLSAKIPDVVSTGEIRSLPKEVALNNWRKDRQMISQAFVANAAAREIQNLASEPEPLTQKKDVISSWVQVVASMNYVKCGNEQWGISIDEEPPAVLREILYDALHYSEDDGAFLYAEAELKYSPVSTKATSKDKAPPPTHSNFPGFTEPLNGIQKNKLSDYVLAIKTTHLLTQTKKLSEPRLDMVIAKIENCITTTSTTIIYEQLRAYAARYVKEEIKKHANAAVHGRRILAEPDVSLTGEVRDQSWTGSFGVSPLAEARGIEKGNNKEIGGKKVLYEGIIHAAPPVVGKVIKGAGQILLRVAGLANGVNYEIPITFQQASKECLVPLQFLHKDSHLVGKRLLEGYKEVMLKQYYGLYLGTKEDLSKSKSRKSSRAII